MLSTLDGSLDRNTVTAYAIFMKNHKNHAQNKNQMVVWIIIIVQVLLIIWISWLQISISIRDRVYEQNLRQTLDDQLTLKFCIEHQLKSCNVDTVNEWKKQHPNEV